MTPVGWLLITLLGFLGGFVGGYLSLVFQTSRNQARRLPPPERGGGVVSRGRHGERFQLWVKDDLRYLGDDSGEARRHAEYARIEREPFKLYDGGQLRDEGT